jgi:hypothetical protein
VGIAKGTIEPLDGGQRSRVTIAFDFEAHRIGKLLVPLVVRRQVRRVLPGTSKSSKRSLRGRVTPLTRQVCRDKSTTDVAGERRG